VGWLPLRWVFFVLCSVAALLCCGAAVWVQQQIENRRVIEAQSALLSQNNEDVNLHAASDARATDEMTAATLHDSEHGSGNAAVAAESTGVQQSATDSVAPVGNRPTTGTQNRPAGENRPSSKTGSASTAASSRANTKQAEEDYE
jgi:hypothetical protein